RPRLPGPDSDSLARKRSLERRDRHDNTHHGCRARRWKGRVLSTKGQKRRRACSPAPAEDGDPWKLDSQVPPSRRECLRYLGLPYRSEFRPLGHHNRSPIGCRAALECWLRCTRNQAQSVESTHELGSAAKLGESPETRHGSESVFA